MKAAESGVPDWDMSRNRHPLGVNAINDGPDDLARRQKKKLLQWKGIIRSSGETMD